MLATELAVAAAVPASTCRLEIAKLLDSLVSIVIFHLFATRSGSSFINAEFYMAWMELPVISCHSGLSDDIERRSAMWFYQVIANAIERDHWPAIWIS